MSTFFEIAVALSSGKNPIITNKDIKMKNEDKLMEAFKSEFALMRKDFENGFSKLREELLERISSLEITFQNQLEQKNQEIKAIKDENQILRTSLKKLEEKIDDSEALEKRDCIVISGNIPTAEIGENCVQKVHDLIKNKLRINIQPSDVSTAYRLGKKPVSQQPDKRKIMVKLCRRDLKKDILNACKEIKPGFFINESLTPTRNTILYILRQIKREPNSLLKGATTIDGRVFAWIKKKF